MILKLRLLELEVLNRSKILGLLIIVLSVMSYIDVRAQKNLYNVILSPYGYVRQSGSMVGVYAYVMRLNSEDTIKYYLDASELNIEVSDIEINYCYLYNSEKQGNNELENFCLCFWRTLKDCLKFDGKNLKLKNMKFYVDIEYDDDDNNLEKYIIKKDMFFSKQIKLGRMYKLIRVLKLHKIEF